MSDFLSVLTGTWGDRDRKEKARPAAVLETKFESLDPAGLEAIFF